MQRVSLRYWCLTAPSAAPLSFHVLYRYWCVTVRLPHRQVPPVLGEIVEDMFLALHETVCGLFELLFSITLVVCRALPGIRLASSFYL